MQGPVLLEIARGTLAEALGGPAVARPDGHAFLDEKRAVFVTLTKWGELRGCIGQLEARFTLFEAVREAARAAGFKDPRFPPLTKEELTQVHIEISVLSPLERLEVETQADALRLIRPGVDGVVLRWGGRSGVFIPEMWKQLPDPEEFLFYLKRKAGLPTDTWLEGTHVERFTAEVWHEPRLN
jgi:AmmeMemoRadiSam system protein A